MAAGGQNLSSSLHHIDFSTTIWGIEIWHFQTEILYGINLRLNNYQSSVFSAVNISLFQAFSRHRLWHNNEQIQHTERIPKSRKLHHESIHFKKTWGIKITTSVLKLNFLSNWNTFKRAQQEILIPVIQRFGRLSSKIPFDKTAAKFFAAWLSFRATVTII